MPTQPPTLTARTTQRSLPFVLLVIHFARAAVVAESVPLRATLVERDGATGVEYRSGDTLVVRSSAAAPAGVELKLPGAEWAAVQFKTKTGQAGVLELGPQKIGALTMRWRITQKTPSLVERTLEVTADTAQRFTVAFPLDFALDGEFASFSGPVKARTLFGTDGTTICDPNRASEGADKVFQRIYHRAI